MHVMRLVPSVVAGVVIHSYLAVNYPMHSACHNPNGGIPQIPLHPNVQHGRIGVHVVLFVKVSHHTIRPLLSTDVRILLSYLYV
jgi:hypothetical protein